MEGTYRRTERTFIRLILGAGGGLVLLVLLGWGGFHLYWSWQEHHLLRRAAAIMSGGDYKLASMAVQRVLQLNPDNLAANRLLAELAEKGQDRSAVDLRRKVYEANPQSVEDGLAYVRALLWFNEIPTAEKVLARIAPAATKSATFYAASGRLAEMKKDLPTAEADWARAVELAPNESAYRLQLSLTRLSMNDPAKRELALRDLEQLRKGSAQRAAAARAMIVDAVAHGEDSQKVRAMAEELQSWKEAMFADRLLYLEILRQLHAPEFENYLAQLKTEAAGNPGDLSGLLSWMLRNGRQSEALQFAVSLPPEKAGQWPVPMVLAEARAQLKDWPALEKQTRSANWYDYDFLRRAYLSRALRAQGNSSAAEGELAAAEKEAAAHPQMISLLTQTIADWGWQDEAVEILWALTKNPETKETALRSLYQYYANRGDTPGLYRTLTRMVEANPNDVGLENNLAQVSLLIGADLERARRMAAEVSAKDPSNPAFLSTYAFALLSNGETGRALQVMQSLPEERLRDPATATYYGLVLAAAGEREKAQKFLSRSVEAQLLPEERALVAKAQSNLQ